MGSLKGAETAAVVDISGSSRTGSIEWIDGKAAAAAPRIIGAFAYDRFSLPKALAPLLAWGRRVRDATHRGLASVRAER
jgi:hypothetical protein